MWRPDDPQGNESAKIRFELVRYTNGRVLDIGCGPWRAYSHFIGVDNKPWEGPLGPNLIADCLHLDFLAAESFDAVYSSHTLEHIEDTHAALAHWWRLVRPGGHLILYLPHKAFYPNIGSPYANPDHAHDFLPEDIVRAMKSAAPDWDLIVNDERNNDREYSFLQVYRKLPAGEGQKLGHLKPRPAKKAAVVRYGAYGDALWASSILPHLKAEGYHVTLYTEKAGAEALADDPHIDEFVIQGSSQVPDHELIQFWIWESRKYDRFINLVGSVETRLLPQTRDAEFHWPDELRRELMDENYLEAVHTFARVPMDFRQKFYPTPAEMVWAQDLRSQMVGPVVVLNPSGSSLPKFWPYGQQLMDALAEKQVHCVVLGDLRGKTLVAPKTYGHVIGLDWSIREAMAFAQCADVVVGTESAIVNSVALEDNLKVVLLSHSTPNNLTKHWKHTVPVKPAGLACYPCHRVHMISYWCTKDPTTQTSACQAAASAEAVTNIITRYLETRGS